MKTRCWTADPGLAGERRALKRARLFVTRYIVMLYYEPPHIEDFWQRKHVPERSRSYVCQQERFLPSVVQPTGGVQIVRKRRRSALCPRKYIYIPHV